MSPRTKRPAEFGPYARAYCSILDQPWPESERLRFIGLWVSVLLQMKRARVDLGDGWLRLGSRALRDITGRRSAPAAIRDLRRLARIVELELSTDRTIVEPQTNWTGTEDELDANRVLLASVRSRNYLRIHEVVPTFVGVSQGEGEGGFLRGVWGDPEGGARPGAAEVTGGPAAPASPPPAGGPGVVAARFAAAVAELGLLAGAPRARLGAATVGRVAAAIPLSSLDGDEAGWREVARNLVESAVAKGVAPDHFLGGRVEDLASKLERLRNGPLWSTDGASGADRPAGRDPDREETIEAERARVAAERARPVATQEEIRAVTEELARKLGWPDRRRRAGSVDVAGERERQRAELRAAEESRA